MRDPLPLEEHFPDPRQLELADRAWDSISLILDGLAQRTSCSNAAIQDLLANVYRDWDTAAELQLQLHQARRKANG